MEQQPTQSRSRRRPLVIVGIAAGVLVGACLCLIVFTALLPDTNTREASTSLSERADTAPLSADTLETATSTVEPTTIATTPPEATVIPTESGPVLVGLNEEVMTENWAVKITDVERTGSLDWQGRSLEAVGQWVIIWAEARNLTTQPTILSGSDFRLTTPELKGEIRQDGSATRAATALRYDPSDTVADFFGMTVEAGSSRPMALAFDVPPAAVDLVLHVDRDAGLVTLGRVDAIAAMPTPAATATPIPTDTPVAAATPAPTDTPKPTLLPEAVPPTATQPVAGPIANRGANLRAGPGTDYDQVGQVSAGQSLDLIATSQTGEWYKLASGAWIAAFLVDSAPSGLPIAEASAPESQPPTATAPPSAASTSRPVRIGTHIVGQDIQPGIYRGVAGQDLFDSCYWERMSDLTGGLGSTIANDNAVGQFYVEVKATDYAFQTACALTPLAQAPAPSVSDTIAAGIYLVGRDIRPGTYKGEAGADILESCYWARLNDVSGGMGSIIANDNAMGSFFVQVLGSDFALQTACSLVRVGD